MTIKNVVFDIGNVLVRWNPEEIVRLTFGERVDVAETRRQIFRNDIWLDLNRGTLTETQAKQAYQQQYNFTENAVDTLFYYIKQTQILLYGSVDLLQRVKSAGYGVYALTDNVLAIVEHLQATYDFWELFDGAVVSADVGLLKPQPEIYQILLSENELIATESLFLDDRLSNVEGAKSVGMKAIQFETAYQADNLLKNEYGLVF